MSAIPTHLSGLVDDASSFPPVSLPPAEAVAQHRRHRSSEYADLVGRLVLTDARLPDVAPYVADDAPLDVLVVVTGGAGALEPAVTWAGRTPGLRLAGVALRLRDEANLAHNAGRAVAMVDHLRSTGDLAEEVEVLVEPPRLAHSPEHGWLAALDEIAMADLALRFRTGGADPEDRPEPAELARGIDAALDRETPYAATGALAGVSDPERYGVLNLLVATRAALDGDDVVAALTSSTPLDRADPDALLRTRRWFTSGTSTDLLEVHEDLVEAGAL